MDILTFDELPQGGFAGLREKRFVVDRRLFGNNKNTAFQDGIGNFVYLADANFVPNGETGLHPHREIDVISIMVDGNISHAGSLEHGQGLAAGMVQVQRAGGEGFEHNEINPDDTKNHMIQIWVTPDEPGEPGEPAGYKVYNPKSGELVHVYGGSKDQDERFYSKTHIDVVNTIPEQSIAHTGDFMAYLSKGSGTINGKTVAPRTLIRASSMDFKAEDAGQLILIYTS
ncbi:MAG: pilus assembly protein [Alphaproteobacteria bacterium]|nr:MAG: pilus assembly protein [Alphaproteobacteria bacterium]